METPKPQPASDAAQAPKDAGPKRPDWTARLNKSKAADYVVVALALLPAFWLYYDSYSPTAAIYFTYFKNFFQLPFSFQPDTVAFGATSPLHVLIHAPIYALFGEYWILASKLVNFLLVLAGVILLNRAIKGGVRTILLTSLLAIVSAGMLLSVSQLFETGLAFFAMALLYHDLIEKQTERALIVSGCLYLVRPELLFVTIVVDTYILLQSDKPKQLVPWLLAGLAPVLLYHGYMLFASGSLVPMALLKPVILYIQEPTSWLSRFSVTLGGLWNSQGLIYIAGAVLILVLLVEWSAPRYSRELLLIAPLVGVYLIAPPQEPIVRYLVPVLPALIAIMVRYIEKDLRVQHSARALVVSLVLAHMFGVATRASLPQTDPDRMLMTDLSKGINDLASAEDHVLLYNIQGQFAMESPCHDLSGSVGQEMPDLLLRRTSVRDFILDHDVRYVVTSDHLDSRPLYANTLLEELSRQDPARVLGDTVVLEGLAFQKMFSHSAFVRRAALMQMISESAGQYPEPRSYTSSGRFDTHWNTVYQVLGDAASLTPAPVVAYTESPAVISELESAEFSEGETPVESTQPRIEPESLPETGSGAEAQAVPAEPAEPASESPPLEAEPQAGEAVPVTVSDTTGSSTGP